MKEILNSKKLFLQRYASRVPNIFDVVKTVAGGSAVAGGVVGSAAYAASVAATQASGWSLVSSWPVIGGFAAGKAAAAGTAAAIATASSVAVIAPAVLLGGGAAYMIYKKRKKATLRRDSEVEVLANAFARVACLPMMALAVSVCKGDPRNAEPVRTYLLKELGAWGYAESYVKAGFDEAMRYSADELNSQYEWAMGQLKSGTTEGIGATPEELPYKAIRGFADDFRKGFEFCIG